MADDEIRVRADKIRQDVLACLREAAPGGTGAGKAVMAFVDAFLDGAELITRRASALEKHGDEPNQHETAVDLYSLLERSADAAVRSIDDLVNETVPTTRRRFSASRLDSMTNHRRNNSTWGGAETNMPTTIAFKVDRLGDLDPDYEAIIHGVVEEEGLRVDKVAVLPSYLNVTLMGASGDDRARLGAIADRIKRRIEGAILSSKSGKSQPPTSVFVNHGQVAAMGPNATASQNSFQQIAGDPTTTAQLLEQIERLQSAVRKSQAADEDLEAVVQAKVEAKSGRMNKALDFLGARAKTLLTFAESAGLKMLAEYIRLRAGLPPIS